MEVPRPAAVEDPIMAILFWERQNTGIARQQVRTVSNLYIRDRFSECYEKARQGAMRILEVINSNGEIGKKWGTKIGQN
jgi:hypothetical protein